MVRVVDEGWVGAAVVGGAGQSVSGCDSPLYRGFPSGGCLASGVVENLLRRGDVSSSEARSEVQQRGVRSSDGAREVSGNNPPLPGDRCPLGIEQEDLAETWVLIVYVGRRDVACEGHTDRLGHGIGGVDHCGRHISEVIRSADVCVDRWRGPGVAVCILYSVLPIDLDTSNQPRVSHG